MRDGCPDCGSVAIKFRVRSHNYRCRNCHNVFNEPTSVEKLHNYLGHCIERPA